MRLRLTTIPLAVLLLAFFCASATAVAPAKVKKHDVDLTWKPDDQDLVPGRIVLDTFDSFGPPFGPDVAVETLTPRSQIGSDIRSGKWRVSVNPPAHGPDPGKCVGRFTIERNVIETTKTTQTVQYGGTLRLKRCTNTNKFKNAEPGRFGELQGETICSARSCRGGLEITGSMRY